MTYQPGQIAKATVRGVPDVTVMCVDGGDWVWRSAVSIGGTRLHDLENLTDVRPLVVLDLHNASKAAKALRAQANVGVDVVGVDLLLHQIADQIEAQTSPAIEEPKGLGAVVEDGEGDRLTRYCDANDDGEWIGEDGRSWHWGDIDVVRVVWAGVTS